MDRSSKKTVSFESLQKETPGSANNKSATASTSKNTKSSLPSNMSKKIEEAQRKSVLKTQQSKSSGSSKKIIPLVKTNGTNQHHEKIVNKTPTNSKNLTTFGRSSGSRTFTKTNPQIIEKLLDNLPRKEMVSKSNHSPREFVKKNNPSCQKIPSNELVNFISSKDTSNEFDQWVQERSFKIQKIHEELSKLVEESVETYETSKPSIGIQGKEDDIVMNEKKTTKSTKHNEFNR